MEFDNSTYIFDKEFVICFKIDKKKAKNLRDMYEIEQGINDLLERFNIAYYTMYRKENNQVKKLMYIIRTIDDHSEINKGFLEIKNCEVKYQNLDFYTRDILKFLNWKQEISP